MNANLADIDLSNLIETNKLADWSKNLSEQELKIASERAKEALEALQMSSDVNKAELDEQERLVSTIESEIQKRDAQMQVAGERPDLVKRHHEAQDKLKELNAKVDEGRNARDQYLKAGEHMRAVENFMETKESRIAQSAAAKELAAARTSLDAAIDARAANASKDLNPKLDAESLRIEQSKLKLMSVAESEKHLASLSAKHLTALSESAGENLAKLREQNPNAREAIQDQKMLCDALTTETTRRAQAEMKDAQIEAAVERKQAPDAAERREERIEQSAASELQQEQARLEKKSMDAYDKWSAANRVVEEGGLTGDKLAEAKAREKDIFNKHSDILDQQQALREQMDVSKTPDPALKEEREKEVKGLIDRIRNGRQEQRDEHLVADKQLANIKQTEVERLAVVKEAPAKDYVEIETQEKLVQKIDKVADERAEQRKTDVVDVEKKSALVKEQTDSKVQDLIERIRTGQREEKSAEQRATEAKTTATEKVELKAGKSQAFEPHADDEKLDRLRHDMKSSVTNEMHTEASGKYRTALRDYAGCDPAKQLHSALIKEQQFDYKQKSMESKLMSEKTTGAETVRNLRSDLEKLSVDRAENQKTIDKLVSEKQATAQAAKEVKQQEQVAKAVEKTAAPGRANPFEEKAEPVKQVESKTESAKAELVKTPQQELIERMQRNSAAHATANKAGAEKSTAPAAEKQESAKTPSQALNERLARKSEAQAAANIKEGKTKPSERTTESAERVREKIDQQEARRLDETKNKDVNKGLGV